MSKKSIFVVGLVLALVLNLSPSSGALAQCGGSGSGYMSSMHDQHLGSSGHMGSGQMGMYGNQAPVQTDPNAATPGYVAPAPPASGYADPQNAGGYGSGQMMNQGGMGSGHRGHMGTN
ncbi:MAG: hypothetical protein NTY36_12930 [Deltaproteobacteria bacterium]|nr:hypothetical protein [Deltaproteobacteria bacterium]